MVKKAALKTAGISMAGFQPRAKVIDGQTPQAAGSVAPVAPVAAVRVPVGTPPAKPFTGVGNVMAAITREAELTKALSGTRAALDTATQQLDDLRAADVIQALDPRAIRRSHWANRIEAEFSTPEFALLMNEIASAGGNVQPIKVRRISGAAQVFDGQTPIYEIVFGHRRHRACLALGLAVQAVVVDRMDDRTLFEAMDRENRGRKNLSAWEQGRMYDEAIRQGLYPSLRRLSESLGVNLSDAARAVQLAKLPAELVAAFASPLDLQVRWAKPLADALQRDPDGVLGRARVVAAQTGPRPAAEVLARLLAAPAAAKPDATAIMLGKRKLASLRTDQAGRVVVEIEPGMLAADRQGDLIKLLKAFLAERRSA